MIGKTNTGLILGIINVTCDNNCTVVLTQSGQAYSFTQSGTSMSFKLPNAGVWTITATFQGITQVKEVTLTPGQVLNVKVLDDFYLFDNGTYITGFASGWSSGDQTSYVSISSSAGPVYSKSTGSVDLTGYETINAKITGEISGTSHITGEIAFEIVTADNTVLASKSETFSTGEFSGSKSYDTTWTFDVSSINQTVYFRLRAQTWAAGSDVRRARINLYRIQMLS